MFVESGFAVGVVISDIQLTGLQRFIVDGCFFQFQHQMFTFRQKTPKLLAVLFLMQLFNVIDFHALHPCQPRSLPGVSARSASMAIASASATLMPSTPADKIPPA